MDSEGTPELLDVAGNFLCVASAAGFVKLWDVSSRFVASNDGFKKIQTVNLFIETQGPETSCEHQTDNEFDQRTVFGIPTAKN